MSLLDGILGIRSIFRNGLEVITRGALDFKGDGVTVEDNPTTGRTEVTIEGGGGSGGGVPSTNDGRLTGVSGLSVMTADNAALTHIYWAHHKGNRIGLYKDGAWSVIEASQASYQLAGRTAGLPFDVFGYRSGDDLALEVLDWTSATARATALARQDGVIVKSGDATRRYLGTCRPRSATTYSWVTRADVQSTSARLDLWNADNRVVTSWSMIDSATSHTYSTATIRQWGALATAQLDFVVGLQVETMHAALSAHMQGSTTNDARAGWGLDSTTAFVPNHAIGYGLLNATAATGISSIVALQPAIGVHFLAWLQHAGASGTTTWYGDLNIPLTFQTGACGTWAA